MMHLEGACRCGAVRFSVDSHAPVPYQRCYCSVCRKTAGAGGYAINLSAVADTLRVEDRSAIGAFHAEIDGETSPAERSFCSRCGTPLWLWDPRWPELLHPLASVIDTPLPTPPATTHLLLADKPDWVVPQIGEDDLVFDGLPEESIEDWHKRHGLWLA